MRDKTIDDISKMIQYVMIQVFGALVGALYTHRETTIGYVSIVVAVIVSSIVYYIILWYNWAKSTEIEYKGRFYNGAVYRMVYDTEEKVCQVYGDYRLIPLYTEKAKKQGKSMVKEIGAKGKIIRHMGREYITEDKDKGFWQMLKVDRLWVILSQLLYAIVEWSVIFFFKPELGTLGIIVVVLCVTIASIPNLRWREW